MTAPFQQGQTLFQKVVKTIEYSKKSTSPQTEWRQVSRQACINSFNRSCSFTTPIKQPRPQKEIDFYNNPTLKKSQYDIQGSRQGIQQEQQFVNSIKAQLDENNQIILSIQAQIQQNEKQIESITKLFNQYYIQKGRNDLIQEKFDYQMIEIIKSRNDQGDVMGSYKYKVQHKIKDVLHEMENDQREIKEMQLKIQDLKRKNQILIQENEEAERRLSEQQPEFEESQNKLEKISTEIGIMRFQIQKKIRFGFHIYNNYHLELTTFDVQDWNQKKRLLMTYNQIKIWILTKLYPLQKGKIRQLSPKSPIYKALIDGDTSGCNETNLQCLNKYLFKTDKKLGTKVHRRVDRTKRFIAIGSQVQDLFQIHISCLQQDLSHFKGYLLEIDSVQIKLHPTQPTLLNFVISYRFDSKAYKKVFVLFDLKGKITSSSIEVLTTHWRKKGEFAGIVSSALGIKRKGIILVQIPKLYEKVKKQQYLKIYNMMKHFKQA